MELKRVTCIILLFMLMCGSPFAKVAAQEREFRGVWIQAVNGQLEGTAVQTQATLRCWLDSLQKVYVNNIFFQVRVECDALYKSPFEPWSRFLTGGKQGDAPDADWDPLQFMVDECHKRSMELHAWINPYRACTATTKELAENHIINLKPENCFKYGDLTLLNPALQENRDYICKIAADIVTRYDVDGIHIDDYFYPYPESGRKIPDMEDFKRDPRGFTDIGDWRRDNVNLFVEQFYKTLKSIKPYLKIGVSPFGVYRNAGKDFPEGSRTNALENYSGLYADVLLWARNGWTDYLVPQLYWNIGYSRADYETLVEWWASAMDTIPQCNLYIGEDVQRTISENQTCAKYDLKRKVNSNSKTSPVKGTVLWLVPLVVEDAGGYRTILRNNYWTAPAVQPQYEKMKGRCPSAPKVRIVRKNGIVYLKWTSGRSGRSVEKPYWYAVMANGKYLTVTKETEFALPYELSTFVARCKADLSVEAIGRNGSVSRVVRVTK